MLSARDNATGGFGLLHVARMFPHSLNDVRRKKIR
jgi:hypothetical protein